MALIIALRNKCHNFIIGQLIAYVANSALSTVCKAALSGCLIKSTLFNIVKLIIQFDCFISILVLNLRFSLLRLGWGPFYTVLLILSLKI